MIRYVLAVIGSVSILCSMAQVLPSIYDTDWSVVSMNRSEVTLPFDSVNIMNFGGDNTGLVSNNAAFIAARNSMIGSSNQKVVYFPKGTFLFDNTITLTSNVIIQGAGSDSTEFRFDNGGVGRTLIQAIGTMGTDSTLIVGHGVKNANKLRIYDPSKFNVSDYVRIIETDNDIMFSSWAYGTLGQFLQITDITGDSISFDSPLRISYPSSRDPYIQKVNFVENVGISCIKIVRTDAATVSGQYSNILFDFTAHSWISGVQSDSTYYAHVDFMNSFKNTIKQSYFKEAYEYGGGGRGYGVVCESSTSECLIVNNIFERLRHSMLLQSGANGNVFSYNYSTDPFWSQFPFPSDVSGDMVLHGNFPFSNLFEHNIVQNIVVDNSHAENGPRNLFFRNQADNVGIFMNSGAGDSTAYIGNEVTAPASLFYGQYLLTGVNNFTYGNNINGVNQPGGTSSLPDNSYYTAIAPDFITGSWPSIGYPNTINSGTVPAEQRHNSMMYTVCDTLPEMIILGFNEIQLEASGNGTDFIEINWYLTSNRNVSAFNIYLINATGERVLHKVVQVFNNDQQAFQTQIEIPSMFTDILLQIEGRYNSSHCCFSNAIDLKPFIQQTEEVAIWPNPFIDVINLRFAKLYSPISHIDIMDVSGVLIERKLPVSIEENEFKLSLSELSSGMYFVQIVFENGVIVKKLLKAPIK